MHAIGIVQKAKMLQALTAEGGVDLQADAAGGFAHIRRPG